MRQLIIIFAAIFTIMLFQNCSPGPVSEHPILIIETEVRTGKFIDNATSMISDEVYPYNPTISTSDRRSIFRFELNLENSTLSTFEVGAVGDPAEVQHDYSLTENQVSLIQEILSTSPICQYKRNPNRVCTMAMPPLQMRITLKDNSVMHWDDMCQAHQLAVCGEERRQKTDEMFDWLDSVISAASTN